MKVIISRYVAELFEASFGLLPPDVIVLEDPVGIEVRPETLERCERAAR